MDTLNLLIWGFDVSVIIGLLWLAWQALLTKETSKGTANESSEGLFRAIVLFIAFGLLMSLAWVRLGAPDVALAEAAIGAGLTGALFLSALARLKAKNKTDSDNANKQEI